MTIREYTTVERVSGPLLVIEKIHNVGYNELVEITTPDGENRKGQVLEAGEGMAVVQVFEGTSGLDAKATRIKFEP